MFPSRSASWAILTQVSLAPLRLTDKNVDSVQHSRPSVTAENAVQMVSHIIKEAPAPKEECALEIIRSGALRQRELHYPASTVTPTLLLRDLAPEFLDGLIRNNMRVENIKRPPPAQGSGH